MRAKRKISIRNVRCECGRFGTPCPGCSKVFCRRCAEKPYEFCDCADKGAA